MSLRSGSDEQPNLILALISRGELSPAERIHYTDAVRCLMRLPPKLAAVGSFPGVRSRFDDFVATHINYTLNSHYSGLFLPWHRQFLWLFEQALRDECNFEAHLPYWNWPLWAGRLAESPLFDGSDTSLSGDGSYNPAEQDISGGDVTLPRGSGGGCVKDGPFKNTIINLGPFPRTILSLTEIPAPQFDYNPRCLNRSLNNFVSAHLTNQAHVASLLATPDIASFQLTLDHWPASPSGVLGLHGGGHLSLGSTMQDLFSSPQDPAFMLHHAMIDRLWGIWQTADEEHRRARDSWDEDGIWDLG
ncbi:N-acetyl-6-hydroxytryptophan oxidase ivoB [Penicillium diatomitis]|uniref:N-acetyl-6-hydroxytryptophan oxidase ivoB n=1 Tax=Penicillium diatomitis TaxID=2819901 RepID=A0A9W9XIV4_9EURO|nr:N-acetyl-6-hydroxytryptophan oxidase ivoB [Penicillium diatomitis]KAJ5493355.1 N-acetyl-6-hydroxytryptophan oxidase ivoB [Penicillium diatomitis]